MMLLTYQLTGGESRLTGKQLKIKRIRKDIKAKDIAEQLNVSRQYISMLEKGIQKIPSHVLIKWKELLA